MVLAGSGGNGGLGEREIAMERGKERKGRRRGKFRKRCGVEVGEWEENTVHTDGVL